MALDQKREGVSVIVCCYNSASRLPRTLEHLIQQKNPKNLKWELIIINNASSDNTVNIATEIWEINKKEVPLKIVDELEPGLSFAREKGISQASYEYIIFCDDDNWLEENYITYAFQLMSDNSHIGALGGYGYPVKSTESPYPDWFETQKQSYAIGSQGDRTEDITLKKGYIYGAGAVLRKSIILDLRKASFKSILSDRKQKELSSGGDIEYCYAIRLAGYQIWYSDKLKFKHFIPIERLNENYLTRLAKANSKARVFLNVYQQGLLKKNFQFKATNLIWLNRVFLAGRGYLVLLSKVVLIKNKNMSINLKLKYLTKRTYFFHLLTSRKQYIKSTNSIQQLYNNLKSVSKYNIFHNQNPNNDK